MSLDNLKTAEYSKFIHRSRYARWDEKLKKREEWKDTIQRFIDFWMKEKPAEFEEVKDKIFKGIYNVEVMPSMRLLMTAGAAAKRDNIAAYNCAYTAIDNPRIFDEILFILLCGTGVGFSIERQYISKLPEVAEEFFPVDTVITVPDSKIGWASSFRQIISLLYQGQIPKWDVSKVRPSGAKLKTFGGRASGPQPLIELFNFAIKIFKDAAGRKLNSIECYDLVCKIASIVVVGGVRRAALISLSNLTDQRMRAAKTGQWWIIEPQRALSNNSVCYTETPDIGIFMDEWRNLYTSKSGERGIFNREAVEKLIPKRRKEINVNYKDWGSNPCSEIILRNKEFCNLSEVIVRYEDDLKILKRKVELTTIIGTFQATLTKFRYISSTWKRNCEEERLLGVSMTGIMDHPILNGSKGYDILKEWLIELKEHAIKINKKWASKLGINQAVAISCIKPSGNVSQLTDTASGIHPRFSPYYIRTVRANADDPLAKFMIDKKFPYEIDQMKPGISLVFKFPIKSPENSVFREDRNAIEQLELWKIYQLYWCEHKPSITVYVKEYEWLEVAAWVYKNFKILSGVSFLPWDNGIHVQAPYQECDEETYKKLLDEMPKNIDWKELEKYENEDNTVGSQEFACTGNKCEIS